MYFNWEKLNTPLVRISYDIIMVLLAAFITISSLFQNQPDITDEQQYLVKRVDFFIWLIFVFDYCLRFMLTKQKWLFVKHNVIDLISILPLDVLFQGLRIARIFRVFYMLRIFIYLTRFYNRLNKIITTNNFHHMLWFTFTVIFSGAIAIAYIDNMSVGDALWWSFVTTTTVGYGDIAPSSLGGRIIAVFLMIVGIGFLSTLTSTISTFFLAKEKKSCRDQIIEQIIVKLEDFSSLRIEDIDDIHAILISLKTRQLKNQDLITNSFQKTQET